jgi:hypothetical protein
MMPVGRATTLHNAAQCGQGNLADWVLKGYPNWQLNDLFLLAQ